MGLFDRLQKSAEKESESARERNVEDKFRRKQLSKGMKTLEKKIKQREPTMSYAQYETEQKNLARQQARDARHEVYRKVARGSGSGISRALEFAVRQRRRQLNVAKGIRRSPVGSGFRAGSGRRGRPRGSFDPRYQSYGGVYEYRRRLNAQLREQKLQFLRSQQMTPQQQALLAREEAYQRAAQVNPENKAVPDTFGTVRLKSIHDEADAYAHLFE